MVSLAVKSVVALCCFVDIFELRMQNPSKLYIFQTKHIKN